ncbi:hydroxyectoine utilization dehydratase EutB [Devosia rhodophyticola]|uniref:Hydroxyectoine utilization dehydratase EutB n=1 Tax=Devosia rhodophyticola TaxID=3026423 RepID=A0ABY7Z1W3_9HYPH|nr:hydroxyectoine utilization dehydratase EutB [Devosia rhodophyticola]
MLLSVAFTQILAARRRIGAHVLRTPQRDAVSLSEKLGVPVRLKCEHHQTTGSFKLRGATNAVLSLCEGERAAGVVAASTGNHGRALAHAARIAGCRAVICVSKLVPANKVAAIKALGGEVHIVGTSQDDAQVEVDRLVREEGMSMVPPFDAVNVIAGQGTLGVEMLEDAPDASAVLVPLSGGGLMAGIARAVKTINPATQLVGVTMEKGAAMHQSLAAKVPVSVTELPTLADSLGGGIGLSNQHSFAMVRDLVDQTILVSEAEIANAMRYAYFEEGEVLEGAAAVPLAALISGRFAPKGEVIALLTGKNIDMALHQRIMAGEDPDLEAEAADA